jgi:malonyl-CoA reductase/3-hydroxypropionate dehydrogenase (NADP+)
MSKDAEGSGRLRGKIALITGGAGNIGEVITRRYLAEGATVAIIGRNEQKLHAYRQRLVDEQHVPPERVLAIRMDGSDMRQVRAGVAELMAALGRVDVLVNNAGSAGARRPLAQIPLDASELQAPDTETLAAGVGNLLGISWNLARAVASHMAAGSSIINISTIFSRTEYYGRIPYVVPKAALNALSLAMAEELGEQGIRVNTIYPGPIDSERIRTVFKAMDGLKGLPEGSTAGGFFDIMRVSRPDERGQLAKGFPKTDDVANAAVFLGSDESVALSGQALEVTNGMAVPLESRTTLVSRPELRTVDASGHVVLICAGDQVEEALAVAGILRVCRAEVVIGFRQRQAIARVEQALEETRHLQGANYQPPLMVYLNPLEPPSVTAALGHIYEATGGPHGVLILPAESHSYGDGRVIGEDDAAIARFTEQELIGVTALATQLARFWQQHPGEAPITDGPRIIFMSNADDGKGNIYAGVLRAAIEQLIRVWRHEDELDIAKGSLARSATVWANQIVRFSNAEPENLDFACAWAARLLTSSRRIEEIDIYLPDKIARTTGAQRPIYGWAERLLGLHTGRVALITGGSAGIGGQIGRLLALAGAQVMLAARGAEQLAQMRATIVGELREAGYPNPEARVRIFADCDVADEASLQQLCEATLAAFGRVDYLINNAGIAGVEEMVIDMPLEGWRNTQRANLISNYSLIRKIAPLMKRQGSGYILNVSSYFGGEKYVAIPYPNRADYAVSKAGQRAMVESLARFMGPEIQINAIAPGPVEGDRLRGTGERPGLFMRRARLILENKRLNDLHTALVEAIRAGAQAESLLPALLANDVQALSSHEQPSLRRLADTIVAQSDPSGAAQRFLMNAAILRKLLARLSTGGEIGPGQSEQSLCATPPEPFFAKSQIEAEARKVRDGVLGMLYLQRMPTEFDVAMATVFYLADQNVTGETFQPSGGLKLERTVTEGELFGKASPQRLHQLRGKTVYLVGEHLRRHIARLARAFLDECQVEKVVLLTESEASARELLSSMGSYHDDGRVFALACGDELEQAFDRAYFEHGKPGPVVSMPFRPLPTSPLSANGDWSDVLSEDGFAAVVEQNLTHHLRVARKVSLVDGAQLVLVTPETSAKSTAEEFALANFIKTTLHALTATLGAESERTVHHVPVNQVDLTRRSRSEEPRGADEEDEELNRFVSAVLLTSAPIPAPSQSRYRARIYRGNAITV